jgi:hypothetical protein
MIPIGRSMGRLGWKRYLSLKREARGWSGLGKTLLQRDSKEIWQIDRGMRRLTHRLGWKHLASLKEQARALKASRPPEDRTNPAVPVIDFDDLPAIPARLLAQIVAP